MFKVIKFEQFLKVVRPAFQTLRLNSNMIITKRKGKFNCETYKCMVLFPDGSTTKIKYHEPRSIIKMPYDPLNPEDKKKLDILASKTVVKHVFKEDEFENEFDLKEYDYLWKKK